MMSISGNGFMGSSSSMIDNIKLYEGWYDTILQIFYRI
jgi:hypothetical protein